MRIRRMFAATGLALALVLTGCGAQGCGDYDDDITSNSADLLADDDDCGDDD